MKLLFDQNLSHKLAGSLADLFPGSLHVRNVGLHSAVDEEVWSFARSHELAIVTKDADFSDMVTLRGAPPKVIWIRRGNCSTMEIEQLLKDHIKDIMNFEKSPDAGTLSIF
jgi:predicted nuclease of predicted toxin-antitoxin system